MKKIIIIFALMISTAVFCQECEYKIKFKERKNSFTLFVETAKEQPSMGNLVITDIQISKSKDDIPGIIYMNLALDPNSIHLPAFGIQKGFFKFFKGDQLPQISSGQYEIIINGIACGQIILSGKKGEYLPLEKSYW
jgi:DNA-directed RNA polymerase subunit RPC12/RpoP